MKKIIIAMTIIFSFVFIQNSFPTIYRWMDKDGIYRWTNTKESIPPGVDWEIVSDKRTPSGVDIRGWIASPKSDAFKLGEAAGEHLYSIAMLNELKNTRCGYIPFEQRPLQIIKSNMQKFLSPQAQKQIDGALNLYNMKAQAKKDIANLYAQYSQNLDEKTVDYNTISSNFSQEFANYSAR